MASKTFKIGEVCKGGVITAETSKTKVIVIVKEWDTSQGYSKNSNQSKAKELWRTEVEIGDENAYRKLHDFVSDASTHYWACNVLDWIEANCDLEMKHFWC